MAQLLERNQIGKVESYEELVAVVDSGDCPLMTMLPKCKKQTQALHNWQAKNYQEASRKGVPDGVDVTEVEHNTREVLQMYWQYFRYAFGVSTLAGESSVHGVKSEMAEQTVDAFVTFKRMIEKQIASDANVRVTDDGVRGTEFRGMFPWLQAAAQTDLPVPAAFRPQGAYTGTLANFDEDAFKAMLNTCFKERKGKGSFKMFMGIDLREKVDLWLTYRETKAGFSTIQCVDTKRNRTVEDVVDRFITSAGEVELHTHSFLRTDIDGAPSAGTDISALMIDMKMWKLNYNRAPNRHKLENRGGGEKAYIDAVANLFCLNPLGQAAALIDS